MRRGWSGRDQADIVAPICGCYHYNAAQKIHTQGRKAEFSLNLLLFAGKGPLIFKDPDGIGEVDSVFS